MEIKAFRIGTRGSPLALKQADMLASALQNAHPDLAIEIVPIKSAGDWNKGDCEKPLCEAAGGKGLFAKEIEAAILKGAVDCGVHSLKDMAAFLPDGLEIKNFLPRADVRDALVSQKYSSINELPVGAIVGTCSVRRQALALAQKPDLKMVPFRGNVQTRIDKVIDGQVEATFLAMAGLERLGIVNDIIYPISVEEMLPACGQGIICMETRVDDARAQEILAAVQCHDTALCALAEREILKILDGSCQTPIGAYARRHARKRKGGQPVLELRAVVASLDGQEIYKEELSRECSCAQEALSIGQEVGKALREKVPQRLLS